MRDTLETYENPLLEEICEDTANVIGGDVTPERVCAVIEASNTGQHMFHGIQWESKMPSVQTEGIAPLTPEGGNVSFWTSGTKIFSNEGDNRQYRTYDTTFFHYGHSASNDPNTSVMNIAVTNPELLRDAGVLFEPDQQMTIPAKVPKEAMALLHVEVDRASEGKEPRGAAQLAEQKMFELIEKALTEGYRGGQEIAVRVTPTGAVQLSS